VAAGRKSSRKMRAVRASSGGTPSVNDADLDIEEDLLRIDPGAGAVYLPGVRVPMPTLGGDATQAEDGEQEGPLPEPDEQREDPCEFETLRLSEILREDMVRMPLRAIEKTEALGELISRLVAAKELPAALARSALDAALERESIRSTGWKMGLAFPSGRVRGLKIITAAVGISPCGVEFRCLDGLPARIVVLVFFPPAIYPRFSLAWEDLHDLFDDAVLREKILAAGSPAEVVSAIEEAETLRET
jgi:mannitol/fructose-specific phosphotransferase system IIA component (Ntr-type)